MSGIRTIVMFALVTTEIIKVIHIIKGKNVYIVILHLLFIFVSLNYQSPVFSFSLTKKRGKKTFTAMHVKISPSLFTFVL